jgi:hypothetical protein
MEQLGPQWMWIPGCADDGEPEQVGQNPRITACGDGHVERRHQHRQLTLALSTLDTRRDM